MRSHITIYDWMLQIGSWHEVAVYALIYQMGERGFWAPFKTMSDRLHIPKAECKQIVQKLIAQNLVYESHATLNHVSRRSFIVNGTTQQLLMQKTDDEND